MRIWFDVDGVLAKFPEKFLEVVGVVTGRQHTLEDVTCFDFDKCIVSPAENRACWALIGRSRGLVESLAPHEDWMQFVEKCRARGHFVGALTAPAHVDFWVPERVRWLERYGFSKDHIVFASCKNHVRGDLLIDDRIENCDAYRSPAWLVDRPWNRGHEAPHVHRMHAPPETL